MGSWLQDSERPPLGKKARVLSNFAKTHRLASLSAADVHQLLIGPLHPEAYTLKRRVRTSSPFQVHDCLSL